MKSLSIDEVQATLEERIGEVRNGEPIVITRDGQPVAALVRFDDVEHLTRLRAAGPRAGLVSIAGGWPGSDGLMREIEATGRSGSRDLPELD